MKYYFYLSYAREDFSPYLERFFDELGEAVRRQAGDAPGVSPGYFDRHEIEAGASWAEALTEALQESATLVCLLSPAYFASEYAGKEVAFFRARWRAAAGADGREQDEIPVIQNVIWRPGQAVAEALPGHQSIWAPEVTEKGLLTLRRLRSRYGDKYDDFLNRLARDVVRAAEDFRLPRLDTTAALDRVESAFDGRPAPAPGDVGGQDYGPKSFHFVCVAGAREQMRAVREVVDSYGEDGLDWRPFHPVYKKSAALLARNCAAETDYPSRLVWPDERLMEHLRSAEQTNTPVVILVDPWTLDLEFYAALMREVDHRRYYNAAVLVVWNQEDWETHAHLDKLQDLVRATFFNWSLSQPSFFYNDIVSPADLREALISALRAIRSNMLKHTVRRLSPDDTLPSIAPAPGREDE